jgi:hypothetical protein
VNYLIIHIFFPVIMDAPEKKQIMGMFERGCCAICHSDNKSPRLLQAVKSLPVRLINDVIFSILEDRSARHYCCVYMWYFKLLLFGLFLFRWFQYSYLDTV